MITMVEVINSQGQTLALPFQDTGSGYVVKDIEGLDPVNATIVSSPFALLDGEQDQNASREKRNIVLKLGLAPDYATTSVSSLRTRLYGYMMPKSYVLLRFWVDGVHFADIQGRVESLKATPFTKDPGADISIICFNPDFIGANSVVVNGHTVADTTEQVLNYPGTVEAGFLFRLLVNREVSELMVYNTVPGGLSYSMEIVGEMVAGDILSISTVPGSKYARLTRGGSVLPFLYAVSPTANWFPFVPGPNNLRVYTEGAVIPLTYEYLPRYGGL